MKTQILSMAAAVTMLTACQEQTAEKTMEDPFLYLEEVEGEKALTWVKGHNATTVESLEKEANFQSDFESILKIKDSKERIIAPSIRGEMAYNFWTDAKNPRGIIRRMSMADFKAGKTDWELVLDVDALGAAEGKKWVYKGMAWLKPDYKKAMMYLSDGGTDACEIREFDAEKKEFIKEGFFLPEAKGGVNWIDENTLLVQTQFDSMSMTTSGYPRIVKEWKRGTDLSTATLQGEFPKDDMGTWGFVMHDNDDQYIGMSQAPDFYTSHKHFRINGEWKELDVPLDADFLSIYQKQALILLKSDWEVAENTFKSGALVSFNFADFMAGKKTVELVFEPNERQSISQVSRAKDFIVVNVLDNVMSSLWKYNWSGDAWTATKIETPEMSTIQVGQVIQESNEFYYYVTNYLQPSTLYVYDGEASSKNQALPEFFQTEGLAVQQLWTTSEDGEKIPYFLIAKEGIELNGKNPTVLYGYGGFEIALKPGYNAANGKAWLEKGGVYVVANIRGGGEFGPRWHQAALKSKRQNAYNDFIAVAEKLIADGYTSSEHLAIKGGSNGGLLMGVMLTQRPDLFKAVICAVPLLDMKRYNKLLAGASWMGEYGNPDIPEEWEYIKKFSPYHNLKEGVEYPEILFVTSTKDDRVHPGHARKMAAKMEGMGLNVHYYENMEGGHGAASTNEQVAKRDAMEYAFLNRFIVPKN